MVYQVPVDLIDRARILLRNEADLGSYNPRDPSFPSLPSVEAVIASFDPSPDCSRCEHCRGKLLRGSQSLICVYCGREPNRDCLPEPLSFKSTIGFRWLVDSLGLDGSEIIEASEDGKQTNEGLKSVKDEISLSEFLSKEMKWPVESERFGLSVSDDLRNHGKGVLRLAGIDFNHSLSEEVENVSDLPIVETISNEESIEKNGWNSRSIDVTPSEGRVGDTFSAWEADFQAASCVAPVPYDDESSKPSKVSSDDFALGPQKDFEEGTSIHDSSHVPSTIEEIETDYRSNLFSGVSSSTILPRNDDSSDPWDSFTSSTVSGDNKHLTSTIDAYKESTSFESWSDFRSSGSPLGGQMESRGLDSAKEMSVSAGYDLFGPWNDGPNLKHSPQVQEEVPDELAVSVDIAHQEDGSFMSELDDNLQQTGTVLTADKVSEKDEYSSTMWDDFLQHNPGDSGSLEFVGGWLNDEGGDTTNRWGNSMSLSSSRREKETNSIETYDDIDIIKDETFVSLNNLTSSATRLDSKSGNEDMTQAWNDISNSNVEQKVVDQQASEDKRIVEAAEQPNSWSNFRSSINTASNNLPGLTDLQSLNQSWDDLSSFALQPGQDHTGPDEVPKSDTAKDEDMFNSWGDFSSTSVLQSTQRKNNGALSEGHRLFNDWSNRASDSKGTSEYQLKLDGDSVPAAITEISEVDDSFGAWSEFTSSTALPSNSFQNSKESQVDGKQHLTGNDPFDAWSLLIPSSSSRSSNQNVTTIEHAIETSLFNSSRNQKVPEFDSSLQPFLFPDAANGSASAGISSSEVLDHFRMEDGGTKSSTSQNDEPQSSGQISWKKPIDADALISQMHDLSFMLESNLSVSKIVD